MPNPNDPRENALMLLIETIEFTGGLTLNERGEYVPVGDPDWADLGSAYLAACDAVGREPLTQEEWDWDEGDEGEGGEGEGGEPAPPPQDALAMIARAADRAREAGVGPQPPPVCG